MPRIVVLIQLDLKQRAGRLGGRGGRGGEGEELGGERQRSQRERGTEESKSNLVFYAQSTNAVISGRERKRQRQRDAVV